jgi:hypothetical protein
MRDLYVIGFIAVVAIVLGTSLFFYGPAPIAPQVSHAIQKTGVTDATVPIVVLAQGADAASIFDRTNFHIKNEHDLTTLWNLVYGSTTTTAPTVPVVDFTKNEVLAVFDGTHATSGYNIQIVSVVDSSTSRTVTVDHTVPATTCVLKHGTTSLFEIIQVPVTTLALVHNDQVSTTTCP